MHKNNFFISFGIWITILPFFGIPGSWRDTLVSLSGIFLILVFSWPVISKKLQIKPKIKKKQSKGPPTNIPEQNDEIKFSDIENLSVSQVEIKEEPKTNQEI